MNKPRPLPPKKKFLVKVMRDTRWDIIRRDEPIEECVVEAISTKFIVDHLAEQHPQWRVSSPVIVSVEEIAR